MAVKLTQELRDFISRREVVKVIATINEDGSPNIGPKGSTHVYDDESLAYAEVTGKHHYHNVRRNTHVAIACIDWQKGEGYRFVGEAELHEAGDVFDQVAGRLPSHIKPKAAVRIPIREVYGLGGAQAGEKLL